MAIHSAIDGRVATITIDRPPLNVLDIATTRELAAALTAIGSNTKLDIVVVRGCGERAFSAGVDIRDHTREKVPQMLDVVHGAMRQLLALPQVTIAAVQGVCLGGGCELASCCDLVVATAESSFATPEITVGCYPPVAVARFASLFGYHHAAEMILTGRRYSAAEAQAIGLVNRIFSAGDFESGMHSLIAELLDKSGAVLRVTLKGLREMANRSLAADLERSERLYCDELLKTDDVEEGVTAFLQKRRPIWRHR